MRYVVGRPGLEPLDPVTTKPSLIGSWFVGVTLYQRRQDVRLFRYAAGGNPNEPRTNFVLPMMADP
jgi:hypothetical protein